MVWFVGERAEKDAWQYWVLYCVVVCFSVTVWLCFCLFKLLLLLLPLCYYYYYYCCAAAATILLLLVLLLLLPPPPPFFACVLLTVRLRRWGIAVFCRWPSFFVLCTKLAKWTYVSATPKLRNWFCLGSEILIYNIKSRFWSVLSVCLPCWLCRRKKDSNSPPPHLWLRLRMVGDK